MIAKLKKMIRQRRERKVIYSTPAYWDHKADEYDDKSVSMWPNNNLNSLYDNEQRAVILRTLGAVRELEVFDLGCGTGRFCRWFAEQGARVTGIDFSGRALAIAKSMSSSDNPSYRQGSLFQIREKSLYDLVFTCGVLTSACRNREELLSVLNSIRRSMRPGGRVFLTEPIHRGFLHRVLNMDLDSFLNVMREAGFEVKSITPLHFWPMRLVLAYLPWPAWLTTPLYHLGQTAMKFPGMNRLGDYCAVLASPTQ